MSKKMLKGTGTTLAVAALVGAVAPTAATPANNIPEQNADPHLRGNTVLDHEALSQTDGKQKIKTGYKVQSGDDLSAIAQKFAVTEKDLIAANRLEAGAALRPGKWLQIPAADADKGSQTKSAPESNTPAAPAPEPVAAAVHTTGNTPAAPAAPLHSAAPAARRIVTPAHPAASAERSADRKALAGYTVFAAFDAKTSLDRNRSVSAAEAKTAVAKKRTRRALSEAPQTDPQPVLVPKISVSASPKQNPSPAPAPAPAAAAVHTAGNTPAAPAAPKTAAQSAAPTEVRKADTPEDTDRLAREVMAGKYGSGETRRALLGSRYAAVQQRVNLLSGSRAQAKPAQTQAAAPKAGKTPKAQLVKNNFPGYTYPQATVNAANENKHALVASKLPSKAEVQRMVAGTAAQMGVNPKLALAHAFVESGFDAAAVSPANAVGTMQVIPGSGKWAGSLVGRKLNLLNPQDNIVAGVAIIRYLQKHADSLEQGIAGYYQGLGGVKKNGMRPDTVKYVAKVKNAMNRF